MAGSLMGSDPSLTLNLLLDVTQSGVTQAPGPSPVVPSDMTKTLVVQNPAVLQQNRSHHQSWCYRCKMPAFLAAPPPPPASPFRFVLSSTCVGVRSYTQTHRHHTNRLASYAFAEVLASCACTGMTWPVIVQSALVSSANQSGHSTPAVA